MALVKNTRLRILVLRVVDMGRVKRDALNVKYLLNGKDYGVLVVDVY